MHGKELETSLLFQEYNESICLQIFQDVYKQCRSDINKINKDFAMESFGENVSTNIITDAFVHYAQWLEIRRKLYPVANNLSCDICNSICKLVEFSSSLSHEIVQNAVHSITAHKNARRKSKQNVIHWAEDLSLNILNESKTTLKHTVDLNLRKFAADMTMHEKLDKWASSFASEVMSKSREDIRSGCMSDRDDTTSIDSWMSFNSRRRSSSKTWNTNNSNNRDIKSNKSHNIETFADQLVQKLLPSQILPSTSVMINCDTPITCAESCESLMSSELLSPHSADTSNQDRGLHYFADKLLYSLSTLDDSSLEALNVGNFTPDLYTSARLHWNERRASAPELRTYFRRPSLRTVPETEGITEITTEAGIVPNNKPLKCQRDLINDYSCTLSHTIIVNGLAQAIQ